MNQTQTRIPTVVIVGGGFGGLHVARGLGQAPVEVLLIDRQNHHLFQPLLYQVASAVLSPADIAQPIRRLLRKQQNTRVVMGEVQAIDPLRRAVNVSGTDVHYDYLVLAAGATHSYFGKDEWAERAPGLKSVDDALEIRRRILLAFEAAEVESDPAARRAKLTFVVIGGGPTGVELAGALKEIAVQSVRSDFRNIDTGTARVILIEGRDRLLPTLSPAASARALEDLIKMGVEVRLNSLVTDIREGLVLIGEEALNAESVFWAAGVKASPLGQQLGAPLDRAGRVQVLSDCSLPNHPEVFVVGDMASLTDSSTGLPVPGVAQGAMQMGRFVAGIIRREVEGERQITRPAFHYRDKGTMATIGRARAVADVWGRTFGGLTAWLLWSFIHVLFLIGFRNKLFVMLAWAWNYLASSKGARLITGSAEVTVKKPAWVQKRVRLAPRKRLRVPANLGDQRPV
jgi:NADH dehydrogenase